MNNVNLDVSFYILLVWKNDHTQLKIRKRKKSILRLFDLLNQFKDSEDGKMIILLVSHSF